MSLEKDVDESEEHLIEALKKYCVTSCPTEQSSPVVQIRFRAPFLQTSKHDARGDAMGLAMESAAQKNIPLWASIMISQHFVDTYAQQLHTSLVPFDGSYEGIDASRWCREVISLFEELMRKYAQGGTPLPVKPESWIACLTHCPLRK
uniref:Uncharacterized protein n=1 Tax=Ditylenchus dipsaci TaxID=166011 RepID=A0A915CSA9_9BILA